jgi:hypothetical protein
VQGNSWAFWALSEQDIQFNLGHVEPTAMLWGIHEFYAATENFTSLFVFRFVITPHQPTVYLQKLR